MQLNISILGDSSSSGIGIGKGVYPYLLYEALRKNRIQCRIANFAVPGMTSSDASMLYWSKIRKVPPDYLVIYLGNNESVRAQRKRHTTYRRWQLNRIFSRRSPDGTTFTPRPSKYEFVDVVRENPSIAVTEGDFRENIESIVGDAIKRRSRVIVVNPIANMQFPAGLGLENAVFLRFVDMPECVGIHLQAVDARSRNLIRGIVCQEMGRYDEMTAIYEDLASQESGMVAFVARHNLAVHCAVKAPEEAKARLLSLLGLFETYDSVIYYNLAQIARKAGAGDQAEKLAQQSYAGDTSLYRIKDAYRKIIANIVETSGALSLDLANVLDSRSFVDYCHPSAEGHRRIAEHMGKMILSDSKVATTNGAAAVHSVYANHFVSPDYYRKPGEDIVDYYKMDAPISRSRIGEIFSHINRLPVNDGEPAERAVGRNSAGEDPLFHCALNFVKANAEHPIFSEDLLRLPEYLPHSHEMLSFPEFYIYRLLYNYYLIYEGMGKCHSSAAVLTSATYKSLILRHNRVPLEMNVQLDAEYLLRIEENVIKRIHSRIVFENAINLRVKTIIYWYTREAFRYGTHSRASMLYERLEIDRLIEALIVAAVIARANSLECRQQRCYALIDCLTQLIDVHERYVDQFILARQFDEVSYQRDLATMEERILHTWGDIDSARKGIPAIQAASVQ